METAQRGVLVAGEGLAREDVTAVVEFAERSGWPVIAEGHSNARHPSVAVAGADALLRDEDFCRRHAPDLIVVAGRVGLSRALLGWLAEQHHVVVDRDGGWTDASRTASAVHRCDVTAFAELTGRAGDEWLPGWRAAGQLVADAIDRVLDASDELTEPRAARDLAAALPNGAALVVASSMPIRDLDLTMRPRSGLMIVANRGVSGIDGFVSTAQGFASASGAVTWALAGDLSLLHDANGLAADPPADVTYVVLNNNGGGIFSLLPQADSVAPEMFERLFGTPHHVNVEALADAYGVNYTRAATANELAQETAKQPKGLTIVEVTTDRAANASLHERLRQAAGAAVPH
jgi:2-succinyl-5-enolpyruvyl-6-hydroxy-3-cyclohexene-1-carboxylate synthase